MSPLIRLIGVGGLIKATGSDRYRPYVRGDEINVTDDDAAAYVGQGVAVLVDPLIAEDAELEQPGPPVVFDPDWSLPELRKFADDRRIALRNARSKGLVIEDIQLALNPPPQGGMPDAG